MLRNGLEPWHLLIVAIVIILLFGSKKLPEAARGLGRSLRILKSGTRTLKDDTAAMVQPLRTSWNQGGEDDVQPDDGHS
ncbi:Sec-independent protein translocase subunit TatA [Streptomyces sp. FXJ1.172]|uniref:Sec-independent protein translocase subunit TatA n=1 Tax=Streptomyces sp. FXJ1.172 TaxID=710705 RepID=UPI00099FD867|nr:Sec-independent protein translocase subunit TatA [Streptomyces sp. FXJ1.172]WEO99457.1 Sec-independent protein translocase subunit TatA [Streptomyces sp. FXJ1.172]